MSKLNYIGRFAPSPSGSLHFGSLLTALASYLDAKSHQGTWLLRIDDIDPPRQQEGAIDNILSTLECLGLHWDHSVIFQSQRYPDYLAFCEQLIQADLIYPCYCSRKKLAEYTEYPGFCRRNLNQDKKQNLIDHLELHAQKVKTASNTDYLKPSLNSYSLRINCYKKAPRIVFSDMLQGEIRSPANLADFVIFRRDSLPAYMLACAFDDAYDRITHIVRGSDLLESSIPQIFLQQLIHQFNHPAQDSLHQANPHQANPHQTTPYQNLLPLYAHIPVITNELGQKLSKQHHAPEINIQQGPELLVKALQALGQNPPTHLSWKSCSQILQWGIEHWDLNKIPKIKQIPFHGIPFQDIPFQDIL